MLLTEGNKDIITTYLIVVEQLGGCARGQLDLLPQSVKRFQGSNCANSCLEQSVIVVLATNPWLRRVGMRSIGLLVNYLYINRGQVTLPATR